MTPRAPACRFGAGDSPVGPPNVRLEPGKPIPPEMLAGMLNAARQSLFDGNYSQAIAAYQAVLKRDARNVDALTHMGLIVAIGGHADTAIETIDKALAIDPKYRSATVVPVLFSAEAGLRGAGRRRAQAGAEGADHDRVVGRWWRRQKQEAEPGAGAPRQRKSRDVKPAPSSPLPPAPASRSHLRNRGRGRDGPLRLLQVARVPAERTEAEMAMGDERPEPEPGAEREGGPV